MDFASVMPQNTIMPAAPVAIIDALNSLLEAEQGSIFRFMGEGSPYLSRAGGEIRRPLVEMVKTNERHSAELYGLIDYLGGVPRNRPIHEEEQYLAFLSFKFLLPKLVEAMRLSIERYENALKAIGSGPEEVTRILESHIAEHRGELAVLEKVAAHVAAKK